MKTPKQASLVRRHRRRRPRIETLESRLLLAADWRNPVDALDVNRDSLVTPLDALIVLNEVARRNREGITELEPRPADSPLPYYDVGGDERIVPLDALRVLNGIRPLTQGLYVLQEADTAASELVVTIGLGGDSGSRTYQFDVDAAFDSGTDNPAVRDALAVYLVDPESPGETLLDRGEPGTALFVLSGERADYPPGLVRFDGRRVSIDLTELDDRDTGRLVFQLISQNDRSGSSVTVRPHSNQIDPEGAASPRLLSRDQLVVPGAELGFAGLTAAAEGQFEIDLRNIRFNRHTGRYDAELRLINRGEPVGRSVAVVFPGLPEDATLADAAGTTPAGHPFLSLRPAIPAGGLGTGQRTEPVPISITTAGLHRFTLATVVFIGEPNRAPVFPPLEPISVRPGERVDIALGASDPDGDRMTYSLRGTDGPTLLLDGNGVLSVMPTPQQIGSYTVTLVASDGRFNTRQDMQIDVVADPLGTTRVSGRVLDVDGTPLHGLQVEVAGVQGLTMSDGRFTLDLGSGPLAGDTLRVRGETFPGEASYPFIAEKLPFMLGREIYDGFDNVINRPIYLPKLNAGQPVNPAVNTSIEATLREDHAPVRVDIAAGSLLTQQGTPFTGNLSITEVPVDLTPATLPPNLLPDQLITIQPGEMVFATPAPLSFPNTAGWEPDTFMDLWSINPVTGEFEIVGTGTVSTDGSIIETVSGGIRNSSWHFFAPPPPENKDPGENDFNSVGGCNNCPATTSGNSLFELHSGVMTERHDLVTYQSLGQSRGVSLVYDSGRADPRPIVHLGFINVIQTQDRRMVARLAFHRGDLTFEVPGAPAEVSGLSGGEHFFRLAPVDGEVDAAIQADLRNLPSRRYDYTLASGLLRLGGSGLTGTLSEAEGQVLHVNTIGSPLGNGWGIAGLHQIVENPDGSVLLIDGDGSELVFERDGSAWVSPPGDFSQLEKRPDGTFLRTLKDQTTHEFDDQHRLAAITDRNGNATRYIYTDGRLSKSIDPVGLETHFRYENGRLAEIEDPAGRITQLEHDDAGNLTRVIDPDGSMRTFQYDADRHMTGEVDQRGHAEETAFGFHGRVTEGTRRDGSVIQLDAAQTHGLYPPDATIDLLNAPVATGLGTASTRVADASGNVTQTLLDQAGQAVSREDAVGALPSVARDANNLITSTVDGRGNRVSYSYDHSGNAIRITDAYAGGTDGGAAFFDRILVGPSNAFLSPLTFTATGDLNQDGIDDLVMAFHNDGFPSTTTNVHVRLGRGGGLFGPIKDFTMPLNPAALELGDFNGDGRLDMAVIATDSMLHLYEGMGDGTFRFNTSTQLPYSVRLDHGLQAADINNDDNLDLVYRGLGSEPVLATLLGDGSFGMSPGGATTLPSGTHDDSQNSFRLADVDNDGDLDAVVALGGIQTHSSDPGTSSGIAILLNDSTGNFAAPVVIDVGVPGISNGAQRMQPAGIPNLRLADLNADGWIDIVAAGSSSKGVYAIINNGDGTFGDALHTPVTQTPGSSDSLPSSVELLDINGDGHLDVLALASRRESDRGFAYYNRSGDQVFTLYGTGDGTFEVEQAMVRTLLHPYHSSVINLGDHPGIIIAERSSIMSAEIIPLEMQHGTTTFHPGTVSVGNAGYSQIVDIDGDGDQDVVWIELKDIDHNARTYTVEIWAQDLHAGAISRRLIERIAEDGFVYEFSDVRLYVEDFDHDGRKDILAVIAEKEILALWSTDEPGEFEPATQIYVHGGQLFNTLKPVDFDSDGALDLIVYEGKSVGGRFSLLRNNLDRSFTVSTLHDYPNSVWVQDATVGDVTGDGVLDLVITFFAMTGPGNPDYTGRIHVLRGNGDGTVSAPSAPLNPAPDNWTGFTTVATADVDGDGTDEIIHNAGRDTGSPRPNGRLSIWKWASGQWADQPVFSISTRLDLSGLLLEGEIFPADLNLDGFTDIVVASRKADSRQAVAYLLNDGRGGYGSLERLELANSYQTILGVQITDVIGDALPEIIVTQAGQVSIFENFGRKVAGSPVTMQYDPKFNLVTSRVDELGRKTLYLRDDANGNLLHEVRIVGELDSTLRSGDDPVTSYTYTNDGLIASVTDPLGRTTTFQYDQFARLTATTYAAGTQDEASVGYGYDQSTVAGRAGLITSVTDERGAVTQYDYDTMNRLVRMTEPDPDGPDGPLVSPVYGFEYDAAGNLISLTDAAGVRTTTEYDEQNRPVAITTPTGTARQKYDPAGNLTIATDPLGNATQYRYDGRRRLLETIDAEGGVTKYEYDFADNLRSLTDPVGNITRFHYDERNRLIREIDPAEQTITYEYDATDNLVAKTDRNGRASRYGYDELGRLVTETWGDNGNQIVYQYDSVGNLVAVSDQFSALAFDYDSRDRVHTVDNNGTPGAPHVVLQYAYDAAGNVTSISDTINGAAGATTTYEFDSLQRMTQVAQSGGVTSGKRVDLVYNPLGQFSAIDRFADPGGGELVVRTSYAYDTSNRLADLRHTNAAGAEVAFYEFSYDASSRITSIRDIDGQTTYSYDATDQLTGADRADGDLRGDESYQYDENGNRLTSHLHDSGYVTGPANRLHSDGMYNYEYDNEGNQTRRTEIATGDYREFEWDHRNRLIAITDLAAERAPLQRVEFTYDALDRRITKSVDSDLTDAIDAAVTHFVYDREDVLLDFVDPDGSAGPADPQLAQRYLHGPGIDQIFAQEDGSGEVQWLITDHLGTVRDLVNNDGEVINHVKYDSFGNAIELNNEAFGTRYQFQSREFDAETQLYYFRARHYDAEIGRFVAEDPIGFAGGFTSLYSYVGNSPVAYTDPYGLTPFSNFRHGKKSDQPGDQCEEPGIGSGRLPSFELPMPSDRSFFLPGVRSGVMAGGLAAFIFGGLATSIMVAPVVAPFGNAVYSGIGRAVGPGWRSVGEQIVIGELSPGPGLKDVAGAVIDTLPEWGHNFGGRGRAGGDRSPTQPHLSPMQPHPYGDPFGNVNGLNTQIFP